MEIDTFYKNDDMSFGFTGKEPDNGGSYKFAKNAEYGFTNVDYSEGDLSANGDTFKQSGFNDVSDNVNATGREGEVEKWWSITEAEKKDCKAIEAKMSALERTISTEQKNMSSYKGGDKRVKQEYLNLYIKRMDYFKTIYEGAGCEIAKTDAENKEFDKLLQSVTGGTDNSKTGTYMLVVGGVLVLGLVGFFMYKKFKK
jgi:LPXTG-motif cell wall-anchored protein